MSFCWFCYWGWAEPVSQIYEKYLALTSEKAMNFGPAHIVWSDENFESENIQWCINNANKYPCDSPEETQLVVESLIELLQVPEDIRYPVPKGFDEDEDALPADFPPSDQIKFIGGVKNAR